MARRYLPKQRGFDSFYGFANTGVDYYTHERYGVPSLFRNNERIKEEGHTTDLFRSTALDLPQDVCGGRSKQIDRAADLETSAIEATSAGPVHGQRLPQFEYKAAGVIGL